MEDGVNLTKIWNSTLGTMQVQTSRHEFNTWLRRATLQSVENGVATIGAPSAFFKEGLENRYSNPLRDLLSNLVGVPLQVRVVIAGPQPARAENGPVARELGKDAPMNDYDDPPVRHNGTANSNTYDRLGMQQLEFSSTVRSGMLNSRYTFDRFIVGSSNRLANAACMAVAASRPGARKTRYDTPPTAAGSDT